MWRVVSNICKFLFTEDLAEVSEDPMKFEKSMHYCPGAAVAFGRVVIS